MNELAPLANHSISVVKQSSARLFWTFLACISDSVPASRPTQIIRGLRIVYKNLNISEVIFTSDSVINYLFTLKKCTFKFK